METNELFFLRKAKEFNIDKMNVHPLIKKRWNEGCEGAIKDPEKYRKRIDMLLDIIGFKEGIKVLDVGCGVGLQVIELSNIGAHCIGVDAAEEQIRVLRSGGRLVIEQANLLNPLILLDLLVKYPRRTKGERGGIKWLFTKGGLMENLYGTGWTGKDEDVHSRLWWRMKMKQYSNLEVKEFTSYLVKRKGNSYKILEPVIGNILIIARKRSR